MWIVVFFYDDKMSCSCSCSFSCKVWGMARSLFFIVTIFLLFFSYSENLTAQNKYPNVRGKYSYDLESKEVFDKLAGIPLSSKYGQVKSVKFIYQLEKERLFFMNSLWYPYHYSFCKYLLHYSGSLHDFNKENYQEGRADRAFLLGTLNYFASSDKFILEISVADEMSRDDVVLLYSKVKEGFLLEKELYLFLNNQRLVESFRGEKEVPIITAEEIYGDQQYQALNKKVAYGYLKKIAVDTFKMEQVGVKDLLLFNGSPNDIPLIAGLITTDFQTPLSHINVLCQNRGTPIMAWKRAWESKFFNEFEGELVRFEVKQDTFSMEKADETEAEKFWRKGRKKSKTVLKVDAESKGLWKMESLCFKDIDLVGGKAAHFAELSKVETEEFLEAPIPEGAFAIPFYYYLQHIKACGAIPLVEKVSEKDLSPQEASELLDSIRTLIYSHQVDTNLIREVEEMICNTSPSNRMRFRSSTNAEDVKGFNGAGLYASKTGILGDEVKTIEKAIKKVWASTWGDRAFQERSYFQIDSRSVAMGILVHRSFPDEAANGVCITSNLYRDNVNGFVFNVQLGEESIVKPEPGVSCDQFICYSDSPYEFYTDKDIVEYISLSSLNEGRPIMTTEEILSTTRYLLAVKKHFFDLYEGAKDEGASFSDFALDVEFKLEETSRKLYIKQARLFERAD